MGFFSPDLAAKAVEAVAAQDGKQALTVLYQALIEGASRSATSSSDGSTTMLAVLAAARGGDPKLLQQALDALTAGNTQKCAEILKSLLAAPSSGQSAPPSSQPTPSPDPTTAARREHLAQRLGKR